MTKRHSCNPAARVIEKMGGVAAVAKITKRSLSAVHRWRMPSPQGTAGLIPDDAKTLLLAAAEKRSIRLTWNDFRPPEVRK